MKVPLRFECAHALSTKLTIVVHQTDDYDRPLAKQRVCFGELVKLLVQITLTLRGSAIQEQSDILWVHMTWLVVPILMLAHQKAQDLASLIQWHCGRSCQLRPRLVVVRFGVHEVQSWLASQIYAVHTGHVADSLDVNKSIPS